ncbi:TPA: hypothetical protein DEP96_01700 [Candidatus Uhrbacteria bacterium]|nr:hypothetical protein [Candidatus Uhrbacteria bacterium]
MSLYKQTKDQLIKMMLGSAAVPSGLAELHHYFRVYEPITFSHEVQEDGSIVAISTNFRYGSIITSAPNLAELDSKIKDAILTAFSVPSSYSKEASVKRTTESEYAFA